MAAEDVSANVVLTADNTQYDRSMQQSANETTAAATAIDTLTGKLDQLAKSAGRKMLGIAAIDVAAITAGTAAWASYEKQMSQLQAQAAVLDRTFQSSQRTYQTYTQSVAGLRREFGTTTADAAALTQQISRLTDGTAGVEKLARTFTMMSNATGESSMALQGSLLTLQRMMGTPQRDTAKYADQLTTLAAGANTTASSLADFAGQLAPVGRLLGQSQTDIQGVATAFSKAGQDGYQAASAYTKLVSDISMATQTGSPDLAKYANFLGMTVGHFKELSGSEKIIQIFEQINRQGPAAITELNKLGLDGMRTMRSVTALAQSGGLRSSVEAARDAFGDGSVARGSEASMKGLVDEFSKLREELKQVAESFGKVFAPAAEVGVTALGKLAAVARDVMDSPLGKMAALVAGIAAPFAAMAGTVLIAAKALGTFAGAAALLRGGAMTGFRQQRTINAEGFAGQRAMLVGRDGGPGTWGQRGMFNFGAGVARLSGATPSSGPGMFSRAAGWAMTGTGGAARFLGTTYSPGTQWIPGVRGTGGLDDFTRRPPIFSGERIGQTMMAPINALGATGFGASMRQGMLGTYGKLTGNVFADRAGRLTTIDDAYKMNERISKMGSGVPMAERVKAADAQTMASSKAAKALGDLDKQAMTATRGFQNLGRGMGSLMTMLGATGVGAAKVGMGLGAQAFSLLGGNYLLAGAAGIYGGYKAYQASTNDMNITDATSGNFLSSYYDKYGMQAPSPYSPSYGTPEEVTSTQARTVTQQDAAAANRSDYKYTNELIKNADSQSAALAGVAAQWENIKGNADAVNDLAFDWTAKYGAASTRQLFSDLDAKGADTVAMDAIANLGANAGAGERVGFMDTVTNTLSGSATNDRLNEALAAIGDRSNYLKEVEGTEAAAAWNAQAVDSMVKNFTSEFGGWGGQREQDVVFSQKIFKDILGRDISTDAAKWTADHGPSIEEGMGLEEYLKSQLGEDGLFAAGSEAGTKRLTDVLKNFQLDTALRGDAAIEAIIGAMENPDVPASEKGTTLLQRLSGLGEGARSFLGGDLMQQYKDNIGDAGYLYRAVEGNYAMLADRGMSAAQIVGKTGEIRAGIGDDEDDYAIVAQMVQERARASMALQQPFMSRPQQFKSQVAYIGEAMSFDPTTNQQAQEQEEDVMAFAGQLSAQGEYYKAMLKQQQQFDLQRERAQDDFAISLERMEEQYNISRSRAQEDFHLQRQYQEYDFQLQRRRAEFDYNLQRERGQEQFSRSMFRSHADFNTSRKRQEQDYQHQVLLMVEASAQSMYDIYERVRVQRTTSAAYTVVNAQDQLQRMREQSQNLDQLRGMGLTNDAIQQLGLTKTENAQQLSRFVSEVSNNPEMIEQLNKSIRKRMRAARALVTDESSKEWNEFERQYRLSTRRAQDDFEKAMRRARKDFHIQMDDMEEDFRRSMGRSAEDYETAQDRQQTAFSKSMARGADDYGRSVDHMTDDFNKSMRRAQEDMDLMAKNISGNLIQILTKASNKLSGEVGKQARETLRTFKTLDNELGQTGIEIMERMAQIFGFKYNAPLGGHDTGSDRGGMGKQPDHLPPGMSSPGIQRHEGGTLPGRSVGRDNMHYYSPQHGELHLAGGEAIMVPEWVDQMGGPQAVKVMNYQARYGSGKQWLAGGGTVNPSTRVTMDGEPLTAITKAQLLLAERLGKYNINVMQGSFQPYTEYSGSSHMGPGVADTSPGNFSNQYWQRRVGFAAWGRNFHGAATAGSGAHVHAVSRLDPGARNHAQLSSFARGEDGLGGPDYGPNPPMLPNLMSLLGRFMNLAVSGGDSPAATLGIGNILRDTYPALEKAAGGVKLNGGLFKQGFWSNRINQMARAKFNALEQHYTPSDPAMGLALSNPPSGAGKMNNQELVRKAAQQFGFGNQWPALYKLVMAESGFRNTAQNPSSTAYGMFQFLDGTWGGVGGHKTSDPWLQAIYGMRYIKNRYNDPRGAWNFHQAHNWYGNGGVFSGPQMIGVGERGPETVIPLNEQGASFIADIFRKTQVGLDGRATNVTGSVPMGAPSMYNYQIDRSTNFTGAITVQTANPAEFVNQLKQRQRVMALSQAALGGKKP